MIVIEGLDGVGKTTLVDYFVNMGMRKYHFDYDAKNIDLFTKYMKVLNDETDTLVFDRSFISEMVYGPILRDNCKLSLDQYTSLLQEYKKHGTVIIYLTCPKDILLSRRVDDLKDYEIIDKYYASLNSKYDEIMEYSKDYIDVLQFDSHAMSKEDIQDNTKRLILR